MRHPGPRWSVSGAVAAPSGDAVSLGTEVAHIGTLGSRRAPGLLVSAALAATALGVTRIPALAAAGVSPLVVAIVLGMLATNLPALPRGVIPTDGFDTARGPLLRLAIVLYGFRISLGEMQAAGIDAVLASAIVVISTLLLAWYAGRRWFGLDRESALLIGAGGAICGAAAVLATQGLIRTHPARVGMAVATVVVFGTAGMFVYPLLVPALAQTLGWDAAAQGIYTGSTIHEVAQVLVAGTALGPDVARVALVTKMMRVCMLAPFLLVLSVLWSRRDGAASGLRGIRVPWFALAFLALIVVHPWLALDERLLAAIAFADDLLLATAMAALGLTVRIETVRTAGVRPLLLGLMLFAYLAIGGLALNAAIAMP